MPINVSLDDLLKYTDWERESWLAQLRKHGDQVLKVSTGPHGDGRFQAVGDLVKHIFSAEKRERRSALRAAAYRHGFHPQRQFGGSFSIWPAKP